MDLSKRVAKHVKQFEFFDPLCQERAKEASLGHEYLEMLVVIENKTDTRDLPDHSELRKLSVCRETISIAEMGGGYRNPEKWGNTCAKVKTADDKQLTG